jgi:hypothetical protein
MLDRYIVTIWRQTSDDFGIHSYRLITDNPKATILREVEADRPAFGCNGYLSITKIKVARCREAAHA